MELALVLTFFKIAYLDNVATVNECYGFLLESNAQDNDFIQCQANRNAGVTTSNVGGFGVAVGAANVSRNVFLECKASNQLNNVGGAFAVNVSAGFTMQASTAGILVKCEGSDNVATTRVGVGLHFNGASNWMVQDCLFKRNQGGIIGGGNFAGVGIYEQAGTTILYTKNVAFNNGFGSASAATGAALQMIGVPSITSPADPATNNIAGVTAQWTNMRLFR